MKPSPLFVNMWVPTTKYLGERLVGDRPKFGAEFEKQIQFTEVVGYGDTLLLYIKRETSKKGGFITPLSKLSMNNISNLFGQEKWDVLSKTYLLLR